MTSERLGSLWMIAFILVQTIGFLLRAARLLTSRQYSAWVLVADSLWGFAAFLIPDTPRWFWGAFAAVYAFDVVRWFKSRDDDDDQKKKRRLKYKAKSKLPKLAITSPAYGKVSK